MVAQFNQLLLTPGNSINTTSREQEEIVWPSYDNFYTEEELVDILEWSMRRCWNESKVPMSSHQDRMNGKATDVMLLYLIAGIEVDHKIHHESELVPVMNFYVIAPEWIQERVEPLIERWRADVYKDPDYTNTCV